MEKTLAIIKPDAVERGLIGEIIRDIERNCFKIVDMRIAKLLPSDAEYLYAEHKGKPFFDRLTKFMSSGPLVLLVLERANAIEEWRKQMGPTDIEKARSHFGSIRGKFGRHNRPPHENVVHGSDSPESAVRELTYFYDELVYLPPCLD